jgi:two-component system, chemotaxis family, CheB/CheR fusion protein
MDDRASDVRIVGIGAPAAGIEALKEFFDEMPADTGLAFVVIQPLDPGRPSESAGLLWKSDRMRVAEAEEGCVVQPDHVYTMPPNKFLFTRSGRLHLSETIDREGLRLPIDFFFRSLAEDQRENAIGVLFAGCGSDGMLGIREIHGASGCVIVQDPESAPFDSVIQQSLAAGMVDYALPARQIPGAILGLARDSRAVEDDRPDSDATRAGMSSILDLLASKAKGDFRCYKPNTIHRRIQRRMRLSQINDIADYRGFLSENPAELAKLSQDMLIGVTSFFRDPDAFKELRDKAIASLLQERNNAEPLRVWVAGCASGEEAYSIVILLMEEMARTRKRFKLQVLASDIDAAALKAAREGSYSQSITADLSEERLGRFFIKQDGGYRIDKQVREAVTFASHNVFLDPPFLNMDLISCRNLLIYLEPETQKRVLDLFAFGLKPGGYLFLGKSENPMEDSEVFEPLAKSSRVFRRKPALAAPVPNFALRARAQPASPATMTDSAPTRLSDLNQQVLLNHFNAAIVLVDESGDIRHFYGPTPRYLSHPFGNASLNLFDMTEPSHAPKLRFAVERAAGQNEPVRLTGLEFSRDDAPESVDVTVTPVENPSGARLFAVIFEEAKVPGRGRARQRRGRQNRNQALIERLEAENKNLREQVQATSDGFQVTHEKLTAANEEVISINEELQSANEELVTSKEELQAVNEELVTTNNQLNDKIAELHKSNDDLANFLNSSEVGTIFLDRDLCIRRFTPTTTELVNLLPLDVGRPVSHISNKLIDTDLIAIAGGVMKTLTPVEREVRSTDDVWYMLRCLPYLTSNDVTDGVVFTFTNVTRLKQSEERTTQAKEHAENILYTMREALVVLGPELKVISANAAFYETFQVTPEETEHCLIYELGNQQWDIPELRVLLEGILPTNSTVKDFIVTHDFPTIGRKIMSVNAGRIDNPEKKQIQMILLTITDITERALAQETRARLAAIVDSSDDAIVSKDLNGIIASWNVGAERLFGYTAAEAVGQSITLIIPPDRLDEEPRILEQLKRGERVDHFETVRMRKDGSRLDISLTISPVRDSSGHIVGASKIARDITDRVRAEQQRRDFSRELEKQVAERTAELERANQALLQDIEEREKLEEQLRQSQRLESMGVLAAGVAHDLNNLLNIIQGYASVLTGDATSDDIKESVNAITQTTKRGAVFVEQLLTLARKAEAKMEPVDVNKLIEGLSNLIKGTFPKNIATSLDLLPQPLTIIADESQITQVLLNLCVNARDAMPNGGSLVLKTSLVNGTELDVYGVLHSGDYVAIEIADTGVGMDENIQEKIFEPFFTTKEIGKGTGLGLAVAYGIVKSHNGFINVESQPLRGATFRLYFPAVLPATNPL